MEEIEDTIDIEIEEVEKTNDEDNIVVETAEPEAPTKVSEENSLDKSIEDLKAQLEREKQARLEAERRAYETETSLYQAKNETQSSNLHLVSNAIETIKQTNDVLKNNYREAMSIGDYDTAADIQSAMSSNAAKQIGRAHV